MKKLIIITLILLFSNLQAIAKPKCSSNLDCPGAAPCIGATAVKTTCLDSPTNSLCTKCIDSAYGRYEILGKLYDMECLKSTTVSASPKTGFCEINAIESGLCRINKLLRDSISRYLILFAVVILGINIISGKFSPSSITIIVVAVALMS